MIGKLTHLAVVHSAVCEGTQSRAADAGGPALRDGRQHGPAMPAGAADEVAAIAIAIATPSIPIDAGTQPLWLPVTAEWGERGGIGAEDVPRS